MRVRRQRKLVDRSGLACEPVGDAERRGDVNRLTDPFRVPMGERNARIQADADAGVAVPVARSAATRSA